MRLQWDHETTIVDTTDLNLQTPFPPLHGDRLYVYVKLIFSPDTKWSRDPTSTRFRDGNGRCTYPTRERFTTEGRVVHTPTHSRQSRTYARQRIPFHGQSIQTVGRPTTVTHLVNTEKVSGLLRLFVHSPYYVLLFSVTFLTGRSSEVVRSCETGTIMTKSFYDGRRTVPDLPSPKNSFVPIHYAWDSDSKAKGSEGRKGRLRRPTPTPWQTRNHPNRSESKRGPTTGFSKKRKEGEYSSCRDQSLRIVPTGPSLRPATGSVSTRDSSLHFQSDPLLFPGVGIKGKFLTNGFYLEDHTPLLCALREYGTGERGTMT